MYQTAITVLILILSGCGRSSDVASVEKRSLTPTEKAEQRELLDKEFGNRNPEELVGKSRAEFSRVFELADFVYEFRDGGRGYGYQIRRGAGENEAHVSEAFIRTDGGRPPNKDHRTACQETILKVSIIVPTS